jgi:glutathione S-transferase
MKLYSLPLSPFAARVRGSIYAKNLPIEIVAPPDDWRTSPEYRAVNPLVRIPALVLDDGTSIPESGVIAEYLEEAFPEPALLPRKPADRARVRVVSAAADNYVMQAAFPIFFLFDTPTRDEKAIEAAFAKLDKGLGQLDGLLPANAYAVGGQRTLADTWLTPVRFTLNGLMGFTGRTNLLDRHKRVAGYTEVVQRDPILKRAKAKASA